MKSSDVLTFAAFAAKWTARLLGAGVILLFLAFAAGEGVPRPADLHGRVLVSFAVIALTLASLVAGWWAPRIGGGLALFGAIALAVIMPGLGRTFLIVVPALAGVLFIAGSRAGAAPDFRGRRTIALTGLVLLIGFVLLAANEILLLEPLFTSQPDTRALASEWREGETRLRIALDGSVQGTLFAGSAVAARVVANRTALGRLLHLRTELAIRGTVDNRRFYMPFTVRGGILSGSVCFFEHGRCMPGRQVALARL